MATATYTEYIEINGLPLSTAAWSTEDAATLLDGPNGRGDDLVSTGRRGQVARRRTLDARTITIPIVVNGYYDSDGAAHVDPRQGLVDNLDELKAALTPSTTVEGTQLLRWWLPDGGWREGYVQVSPAIRVASVGPHAARAVITAKLVAGVLRNPSPTYNTLDLPSGTTTGTLSTNIPGTGIVEDVVVGLTGLATWGAGSTNISTGVGAPTLPGVSGEYYVDEDPTLLYSQLYYYNGSGWLGPLDYQSSISAPTSSDVYGEDYWVELSGGGIAAVYGPRTLAAPNAVDITLETSTYDPTGNTYIEYTGTIDDVLTINAGTYSGTVGSTEIGGAIINAGSVIWLPLLPGNNDITVTLSSNSADAVLYTSAAAVWL